VGTLFFYYDASTAYSATGIIRTSTYTIDHAVCMAKTQ